MIAGPAPDAAVLIRPLCADEAAAAHECAYATFCDLDRRGGQESPEHTDELRRAEQQWAVEIAVAAGLSLRPAGSSCWRRRLGPVSPYLPSGAYG